MTTPDEFDVIVVGTGLVESILAAAFARSGKRVLYVDDAKWYGGDSATLSLSEFSTVLQSSRQTASSPAVEQPQVENVQSYLAGTSLSGIRLLDIVGEAPQGRESDYNIDLSPRLVFCRGSCVDILAESGVARYLEFQTLDSTLYLGPEESPSPIVVPHSKSQVFSTSDLKMVEKRQLMRFLQFCVDYKSGDDVEWTNEKLGASNPGRALTRPQNKSEDAELKGKALENPGEPLEWFLKEHVRMSPRLCDVVRFAILHQASPSCNVNVGEGMLQIGRYLGALGRFGSTPYLIPMYGTGEICQGFSRLCAVYAGVCALGIRPLALSPQAVHFSDPQDNSGERFGDRLPPCVKATLACVVSASYIESGQPLFPCEASFQEVRCVAIVSKSLVGETLGRVAFSMHPLNDEDPLIFGIQLDHVAKAAPQGRFVIHLTARTSAARDVAQVRSLLELRLRALCQTAAAQLVYAAFYTKKVFKSKSSPGLFIVGDANSDSASSLVVDADSAFDQAKRIFDQILPGELFLAPSETELQARREEAQMRAVPDLE